MIVYFDSSVLLTILLNEERYGEACSMWDGADFCLSSFLLRIETCVSLRRVHKVSAHKNNIFWLSQKTDELYGMLKDIHYKPIDNEIELIINQNEKLSICKSLDAIHLATALYFKKNCREQNIILCSFDKNVLNLAELLGFQTFPVTSYLP
jgi:predicted nucleic acid-binding protein